MTGPDDTPPPQTAPRFDHVLYGLPGEVPTVPVDEEPKTGLFRTGKRKAGAGIVAALVLSGGAGAAYAMHERNAQAEAERNQVRVEASSLEVAHAAAIEEARAMLGEQLDLAREVYAQSRDILDADHEARVALRTAIADAEQTYDADDVTDADDLAEATEALKAATEEVEVATDAEARAVLTEALTDAREVHTESEGRVADDAIRVQLAEVIERSEELLESSDASPRALVSRAEELAEATSAVIEAVETYELEQQQQQPVWEEPVVAPPVQPEPVPRGNTDPGTGVGDRPSRHSPPPEDEESSPEPTESPAAEPTPEPTQSAPEPTERPTPTTPPSTEPPADDAGE